MKKDLKLITDEVTGPYSSSIPFYGTAGFKYTRDGLHLDQNTEIQIFESQCIYYIDAIYYEIGKDGSFMLRSEHFEDFLLSAYTYLIGPEDAKKLLIDFPDEEALREAFGNSKGQDEFLRYCTNMKIHVDYTKYWI